MPFLALDSTARDLQLLEEEFVRCIRRRDPERLVETFYAPDAELQAPGAPAVTGRRAMSARMVASLSGLEECCPFSRKLATTSAFSPSWALMCSSSS